MENFRPWDAPDTFGKVALHPSALQAHLEQWPLKLSRVSSVSPYFHRSHLLIAADCTAYSCLYFHQAVLKHRLLTICCPDMEAERLSSKITEIISANDILSIQIVRMDAPCCGKLADMVINAVMRSRKDIPIKITTVFAEGENVEGGSGEN